MPNHITNKITFKGTDQQVSDVKEFIKGEPFDNGEERKIDFNKVIPMPKGVEVETNSRVTQWVSICTNGVRSSDGSEADILKRLQLANAIKALEGPENVKDFSEKDFEDFVQCLRNVRSSGFMNWYEWSIQNWGTKWNAYGFGDRDTNDTIYFETAWSAPLPVLEKLAEKFPDVIIDFKWADEDTGTNTGHIVVKGGEVLVDERPKNRSKEAYEMRFDLVPEDKENYKLVGDKYEYQ